MLRPAFDVVWDTYGNSYPASRSYSEAEVLFDTLLNTGAVVAYLAIHPPYPGTERLNQIAQMAREKGVIVIDGMNGFWNDPSRMSDQLHPNDKGYAEMCQRIIASIGAHYP